MLDLRTQKDLENLRFWWTKRMIFGLRKVRAYKFVTNERISPINRDNVLQYLDGKTLKVPDADTNIHEDCSRGIHVSCANWVYQAWRQDNGHLNNHKFVAIEFRVKDIAAINPHFGKFRLFRGTVKCEVLIDSKGNVSRMQRL